MPRTRPLVALGLALALQLPLAATALAQGSDNPPSGGDSAVESDSVFPFVILLAVLALFALGAVMLYRRAQAGRGTAPASGTDTFDVPRTGRGGPVA